MKLKELLDAVNLKAFNLDVIGMRCHWSNSEHTDITYSGEIVHDYYCLTKDVVDTKFLEYTVVDISGFDDGLSITIDQQEEKEVKTETPEKTIKKLEAKVQELQNICFEYSAAAYELIGELSDESSLTTFEHLALKKLKTAIDENLEEGHYKKYLTCRYIDKDADALNKEIKRCCKEIKEKNESFYKEEGDKFMKNIKADDFPEDDTETLIIVNKKS